MWSPCSGRSLVLLAGILTVAGGFFAAALLLWQGSDETRGHRVASVPWPVVKLRQPPGGARKALPEYSVEPGRVIHHQEGLRTETLRTERGKLRQDTFDKESRPLETRIFKLDKAGRLRSGLIYDGRENPIGSANYYYDPGSARLQAEELFDGKGKLVRRLFYPDPRRNLKSAGEMVLFSGDSWEPDGRAVEIKGEEMEKGAAPVVPQTADGGEFQTFTLIRSANGRKPPLPDPAHSRE